MAETVKDIVDWMKDYPTLLRWDFIAALDITELDAGFAEAHLAKWQKGEGIGAIDANFQIGESPVFHYLSGLRPGPVRVDVGSSDPPRPVIQWSMDVEGGTRTVIEAPRKVRSLSRFDLLNAAQLVSRTPMLAQNGQLLLDMSAGEGGDYRFDTSRSDLEQLEGGRLFWKLFETLAESNPAAVRYAIAGTTETDNPTPYIVPSTWASADGKRVALLLLGTLAHNITGEHPSPENGFPFPLPVETAELGLGTLLINFEGVQRAAFGHAVQQLLDGGAFNYQRQSNGKLRMEATAGALRIPPADYQSLDFNFESKPFDLPGIGLEVDFSEAEPQMLWRQQVDVEFKHWKTGGTPPGFITTTFSLDLSYVFRMFRDSQAEHLVKGQFFAAQREEPEVKLVSGLPEDLDPEELAQIEAFIAHLVTRGIYRALGDKLSALSPEQFMANFALGGLRRFVAQQAQVEAPNNLAVFAPLSSPPRPLSIVEQNVQLLPRQKMTFTLEPDIPNATWTIVPLPGSSGAWGTFDETRREYTAPTANQMGTQETRVLVVATDPATNAESSCKVTVLINAVSVDPLIHVTHASPDDVFRVVLSAGAIGGGELAWSLDEAAKGSLLPAEDGRHCTYVPPSAPVAEATYTVDKVVATSEAGESASSLILIEHKAPTLEVGIAHEQTELGLQLQAWLGVQAVPATWSLHPDSPGHLGAESGLYTPDVYARQRCALIFAEFVLEPLGKFEGYLILPLPLEEHTSVRAFLTFGAPHNLMCPSLWRTA